jgi:type IV pilus assembly protein PilN
MIKINLVSEGRRPVVSRKAKEKLGIAGLALGEGLFLLALLVGAGAVLGYWLHLRGEVKDREQAIATAQKEVEELAQVLKEVEDYKTKKEKLEHKIEVINDLKRSQRGPVRILDQISQALPELLWLEKMTLRGKGVEITGRAFNTNQIATFIENLGKVPEFQEPRLRDTNRQNATYSFTITFNFEIAPPPAPPEGAAGEAKPGAAAAAPAAQT